MRLLNSVCRVIASAYSGVPVHIEEVPNNFERNSFYVTLATGSSELKNINVYEDDPIFQIVYFAKRNEANQVVAEKLYEVKEELKRLFLLKRVVPVIPLAGVKEKPRYAKIENYSDDVRVSEGALYVKITLNFTEDVPVEDNYELIGDVDIETKMLDGQPMISIIGMGDVVVKEAGDRIQSVIDESGYVFPKKRVIISLAPGDKKKRGSHYDLAMAIGVLQVYHYSGCKAAA